MNKIENAKLNMHRKVETLLTKNVIKFVLMTVFPGLLAKLVEGIAMVDSLASKQGECKKKSKAPKAAARKALIRFVIKTTSQLRALAVNDGDIALVDLVKITPSALRKMTDNALVHFTVNVLRYTTDNLADLAQFGVTAQTVTDGQTFLSAYVLEIELLAANKKQLKQLTVDLSLQLKVNEETLELIDSLVATQSETDPSWSGLYFDSRAVEKSASSPVAVDGKVFDAETNQPLPGAIVTVLKAIDGKALTSGADLVKNVKIRSAGGGFRLKSLATSAYLFRVTFAGYTDIEVIGYVNEGYITRIQLPLSKIA